MTLMAGQHGDIFPHSQAMGIIIRSRILWPLGMVRPMIDMVLARIDGRLAELGMAPEAASKAAGLSRSTIRKMHEQAASGFRASVRLSTIEALAPILRVTPEWLAFGVNAPQTEGLVIAPIKARLQAGIWTEHPHDAIDGRGPVFVPADMAPRGAKVYAAEVVGSSMNRVYPEGTIVVLEARFDDASSLIAGRRYHVERRRPDGSVESTIKTVKRRPDDSIWLVPESDDPAFQAAISLPSSDGEQISFVGRVLLAIVPG